ncbi:TBC1 domain family member 15 [Gryllus bimaculatus]|nr:TBC1 domain family member 15 [Gryllus bimaculatus]
MNGVKENGEEVYSHHGVLWKSYGGHKDDDHSGTLSIIDYKCEMCIEWKPSEVSVDSDTNDQEWTMVNTGQQRRNSQGCNEVSSRSKLFVLRLADLHSFKVIKHGHQLLLQSESGLQSVFIFQNGNADSFVAALRGILKSAFKKDRHSYRVVRSPEAKVIDQSFAELELFTEHKSDYVWKFVKDFQYRPYETTMTAFSKLTDAWYTSKVGILTIYGRSSEEKKVEDEVAELLTQSWTPDDQITHIGSEEYEVIGGIPLPQSVPVTRSTPLTVEQWAQLQDDEGRVTDVDMLKMIIFKGGIVPSLRYEVWKFLLGYFPWDSTNTDRQNIRKQKTDEYFRMKLQWKTMSPGQEERFSDYRERKSLIEKDAKRTDRTIEFFAGENNSNLQVLSDILMTYVMYNFDLGYVQGMSDLLSPILCLMTNEADAFWCFVGFMNRVSGIKCQLNELQTLLSVVNPELTSYIRHHDSGNMFFCFRWLLVLFKREFSQADVMKLWEVLWTDLPCTNFHLLICAAILEAEKKVIMEGNYGFTEILKHVNDLSMKIDLEATLCNAESIFLKLKLAAQLPDNVRKIIGLAPHAGYQAENLKSGDSQVNKTDSSLHDTEDSEIVDSLNAVTLVASNEEAAYNCSLSLNYL